MAKDDGDKKRKPNLKWHTAKDVVEERNKGVKQFNKLYGTKIPLCKYKPDEKA